MFSGAFSRNFRWAEYLAWARVLLGLTALLTELFQDRRLSPFFGVALGVFLLYSAAVALRQEARSRIFGLLRLFADTVFFLILANHGAGNSIWLPSIYFLYLLSFAVALTGPAEVFVVVGISLVFCAVAKQAQLAPLERTIMVGGVMAGAFSICKKRLTDRIEQLTRESEGSRQQSLTAAEAERQRIASDFHDGPLQSFISLQMRLEIVRKMLERNPAAGMEELQQLQNLAVSQVRELRAFVRSMRPLELDGANLAASARTLAENFQKESGIPVTFVGGDAPVAVPRELCSEVLQMLREALHNVQKHAGATRVAVGIEKVGKVLELSVDDNGRGFQFSGTYNLDELELLRLGPVSLRRRARAVNAGLTLESRPGRGAGLKVRVTL